MGSIHFEDGSISIPWSQPPSPSSASSRSQFIEGPDLSTVPRETSYHHGLSMQFNNGIGLPDYTGIYDPSGAPLSAASSRISDITPIQRYSQSAMTSHSEYSLGINSTAYPSKAELETNLRAALFNCGLTEADIETRIDNIDNPDSLADITAPWRQQLNEPSTYVSLGTHDHPISPMDSFQFEQSPSSQFSGVPQFDSRFVDRASSRSSSLEEPIVS
jgi:hypothetical protein